MEQNTKAMIPSIGETTINFDSHIKSLTFNLNGSETNTSVSGQVHPTSCSDGKMYIITAELDPGYFLSNVTSTDQEVKEINKFPRIVNGKNVSTIKILANSSGISGTISITSSNSKNVILKDNGVILHPQTKFENLINADGSEYQLPIASSTTAGLTKIGTGISVTEDGTISADIPDIQKASKDIAGIVQIGNGLNVDNGVISTDIDTSIIATREYVTEQIQLSIIDVLNASYTKGGAK